MMNPRLPFAIAVLVLVSSGCSIQIGTSARPVGPQRPEGGAGRPPQMDPSVRQQIVQRETVEIRDGVGQRGPGSGPREGGTGETLHIEVRAHPIPDRSGTYRLHASVERHSSGHSRGEHREEHDHMNLPPLEASVGGDTTKTEAGRLRLLFRVVEESGRLVGHYELGWKSAEGEGMTRSGRLLLDQPGRQGGPDGKPRPGRGPRPGKDDPGS